MKKTTIILFIILIFWACQDIDPLEPPDELSMNYGELVEDTLFATSDSIVINERVNTYNAPKLCIGNYKNFEATILLRFINIPDSGSIVDSVAIEFSTLHVLGEAMSEMPISLYKVDQDWYEKANTADEWHPYEPDPTNEIDAIQLPSEDSTRIKFTISDTSLIREWISDGIYNTGLYLRCTDPAINYIREIASTEYSVDSLAPQITIRYWDEEDSVFVTDTTYIGLDATIFNNNGSEIFDIAQSENDLIVASGIGARTYLEFSDLNLLPPNILVQKTELHLPIWDEDFEIPGQKNSFDNTNDKQNFYINLLTDKSSSELDSVYLNYITMTQSDSLLRISTTNNRAIMGKYLIQNIVNGSRESNWFSIQYQDEGQDLSIKRFRRTADDPARLILRYFKVEQSGF